MLAITDGWETTYLIKILKKTTKNVFKKNQLNSIIEPINSTKSATILMNSTQKIN